AGSLPDELSGGQKQRVAIARCLSMEPEIILFDEPTSALDPTMISEVLAVIRRLAKEGMTMAIVTHEMGFARDVSNRVFYMDEGIIYESGPPEQVFAAPKREKTISFINRLRNFIYEIKSASYDLYAMNGQIEQFCEKHFLSQKMVQNTLLAVEEALNLYFSVPNAGPLKLTLSYSEKSEEMHIILEDQNEAGNFLEKVRADDNLGMTILQAIVHDIAYSRSAAGNKLSMLLNENMRRE
ncbi:MAG TPA: ATP-binding cassette domain-containing protein, partial [Candidatus Marinimicrobia bacterium]|nr:ATP-binding cassette domain-containing protein [Candidatus Neomarinimicrobiota bacterium]